MPDGGQPLGGVPPEAAINCDDDDSTSEGMIPLPPHAVPLPSSAGRTGETQSLGKKPTGARRRGRSEFEGTTTTTTTAPPPSASAPAPPAPPAAAENNNAPPTTTTPNAALPRPSKRARTVSDKATPAAATTATTATTETAAAPTATAAAENEATQAITKSMNGHPFLIHRGDEIFLAASPQNPTALSGMFTHLNRHRHVAETYEAWDPLVTALCEEEGVPGCEVAPSFVVRLRLNDNTHKLFRNQQLQTQAPYNVWYSPRHDTKTPSLHLALRRTVSLHSHQEEALGRVVRHGFAGSGCIVLPCGSGKTLTGIALACKVNKSTLVVCNSLTSVAQWQAAFEQFCETRPGFNLGIFSLKHKTPTDCNMILTTYSIMAADRGMAQKSNFGRLTLETKTWGLILLDEVHCVPTATFQKSLGKLRAKCIVGLTATPLREDTKLGDLPFLISPVTFFEEASWERLTNAGFLARVQCVEVMCSQDETCTARIQAVRDARQGAVKRELITTANPSKLRCCHTLMLFHENQGDKVLIFCDSIYVLNFLGTALDRPVIQGATKDDAKIDILNAFRVKQGGATILFSRVGDTSIDLPEANVIIEVGAHFGSRCQETQRFGRVSRPKVTHPQADPLGPQAFFYSMLTSGTDEVKYGNRRRMFLVEKGYNFAAVSGDALIEYHLANSSTPLCLSTEEEKNEMYDGASKAKSRR